MPRLALGWGASVRSSVSLPASTPNAGRPDVESPATPRLRRTGPAPTASSVSQRATHGGGRACLAASLGQRCAPTPDRAAGSVPAGAGVGRCARPDAEEAGVGPGVLLRRAAVEVLAVERCCEQAG